jgi:hypothetical protein
MALKTPQATTGDDKKYKSRHQNKKQQATNDKQ